MAYAYQQNFYDGASYGWVKYDISPAFGEYVAPGDRPSGGFLCGG